MRITNTIIFLALIILLQIFLSTRKNKWWGLILPILTFLFALIIVPLNMMAPPTGIDSSFILNMAVTFLIFNIPTILFYIIYLVCRKNKEK